MINCRFDTWRPKELSFFRWGSFVEFDEDEVLSRGHFVRFGRFSIQLRRIMGSPTDGDSKVVDKDSK